MAWTKRKPFAGIKGYETSKERKKYGNVRTVVDGIAFASKKEADYYGELKLRQRMVHPEVVDMDTQRTLWLYSYDRPIITYRIDFVVDMADGSIELVEVKGFETRDWQLKWKLLEACIDAPMFRIKNNFDVNADLRMVLVQ